MYFLRLFNYNGEMPHRARNEKVTINRVKRDRTNPIKKVFKYCAVYCMYTVLYTVSITIEKLRHFYETMKLLGEPNFSL
jgi:hypothetical protein